MFIARPPVTDVILRDAADNIFIMFKETNDKNSINIGFI